MSHVSFTGGKTDAVSTLLERISSQVGLYRGSDLGREFAAPADLPDRLPNKIGVELSITADHRYNIVVNMKLATHTKITISTLVMV
jgi:hypothetical protein